MINTTEITKAFIDSKHGWAVAEQFEVTFEQSESFERQNTNALIYIRDMVKDLLNSKILNDDANDELKSYWGDKLPDPDVYPKQFTYYFKLYRYYKNRDML